MDAHGINSRRPVYIQGEELDSILMWEGAKNLQTDLKITLSFFPPRILNHVNEYPTQILNKTTIFKESECLWVSKLQQFVFIKKENSTSSRILCKLGLLRSTRRESSYFLVGILAKPKKERESMLHLR